MVGRLRPSGRFTFRRGVMNATMPAMIKNIPRCFMCPPIAVTVNFGSCLFRWVPLSMFPGYSSSPFPISAKRLISTLPPRAYRSRNRRQKHNSGKRYRRLAAGPVDIHCSESLPLITHYFNGHALAAFLWRVCENRQTRIHQRFKIEGYVDPRRKWGEKHMRRSIAASGVESAHECQ